jgi:hypothetical protein
MEAWLRAPEGVIKINVDDAYAIARDNNGKFMASGCKELHFLADPFVPEAYALRYGLGMVQYLGSKNPAKYILEVISLLSNRRTRRPLTL